MTIRSWYWDKLSCPQWSEERGKSIIYGSRPLKQFPNDFHVFIVTKSQDEPFRNWVKQEHLNIYYQTPYAAHNYCYPYDGPKLLLYILTVKELV